MTNEPNTPEWVKKHNEEEAEKERLAAEAAERRRAAAVSIRENGPDFLVPVCGPRDCQRAGVAGPQG